MDISPLHQAALDWAAQGIPVFPCVPNAKRPAVEGGFKAASCDPEVIDAWWSANPDYNVGISPADAGISIIDTDPPVGEQSWTKLETKHGALGATYTVLSPREGRHRYVRGVLGSTVSRLGPKIDTRGAGGYVLVPPSKTPDGEYRVEVSAPIRVCPGWLTDALAARERQGVGVGAVELDTRDNIEAARRWLATWPAAIEGQGGDDHTFRTGCWLRDRFALTPDGMVEAAREWNERCEPPWDEGELYTKFANADAYSQNDAGAYAGVGLAKIAEAMGVELVTETAAPEKVKDSRFRLWSAAELRGLPPLQWLVEGAIPKGAVGMMYAPPDSFKSFLALAFAMQIACQHDVVYVAGEGSSQFGKRIDAWCMLNEVGPDEHKLRVVRHMPRVDAQGPAGEWQDLIEAIRDADKRPALIVIDTMMQAMVGLEDSSSADASRFTKQMHDLAEACGCAILFIHHTGKDAARGARGSSAIMGDIEYALEVEAHQATKAAAVWVRRQKDAERRTSPFYFEGHVVGASLAFAPIDAKGWRDLTARNDELSVRAVHTVLSAAPEPITTHALAVSLRPKTDDESEEEWQSVLARIGKSLRERTRKDLEAYATGSGQHLRWSLPA